MSSDAIRKEILLHAPLDRIWRALTDSAEFGAWFGVKFDTPFIAGAPIHGVIVTTTVDLQVAAAQKPYEGMPFDIVIDRIEPPRLFSFRWHPFAVEPGVDYSAEATTLVVFELQERPDAVLLTVAESGFDGLPLARRAKAFSANEGGWAVVVTLIARYLGDAR